MLRTQNCASLLQMIETIFDIDKIDRSLGRSKRRRQVWGWVAAKALTEPFYGIDIYMDLRISQSGVHCYLKSLEGFELVARSAVSENPVNTKYDPLFRINDPLWTPINALLIKHGVELPPDLAQ